MRSDQRKLKGRRFAQQKRPRRPSAGAALPHGSTLGANAMRAPQPNKDQRHPRLNFRQAVPESKQNGLSAGASEAA
jgi:hypothetical protein